jgi:ArsR family transcriptional regulator
VRILALLWRDAPLCVCEICDTLHLSQPLVSRHLKQMRETGAVQAEASGKWMLYKLDNTHRLYDCFEKLLEETAHTLPKRVICERREHRKNAE